MVPLKDELKLGGFVSGVAVLGNLTLNVANSQNHGITIEVSYHDGSLNLEIIEGERENV